MTEAEIEIRSANSTLNIAVHGEIDLSNSESVQDEIFTAIDNDVTVVHLDLGNVHRIDSTGIRLLFTLADRLRLLQTPCIVSAPPESRPRRMLEHSGFDAWAEIRD